MLAASALVEGLIEAVTSDEQPGSLSVQRISLTKTDTPNKIALKLVKEIEFLISDIVDILSISLVS